MKQYTVTWGDESATVVAADENEAWAKFCEGHDLASVHPKMHERTIVEVVPPEPKPEKSKGK